MSGGFVKVANTGCPPEGHEYDHGRGPPFTETTRYLAADSIHQFHDRVVKFFVKDQDGKLQPHTFQCLEIFAPRVVTSGHAPGITYWYLEGITAAQFAEKLSEAQRKNIVVDCTCPPEPEAKSEKK